MSKKGWKKQNGQTVEVENEIEEMKLISEESNFFLYTINVFKQVTLAFSPLLREKVVRVQGGQIKKRSR